MLPPTETTPTARDWYLRKFLAVIRKDAININEDPNPNRKLWEININRKLQEYEVNNNPTAHIRPPAMAVRRHPIVLQRSDPIGHRKKAKAIAKEPSQTEITNSSY